MGTHLGRSASVLTLTSHEDRNMKLWGWGGNAFLSLCVIPSHPRFYLKAQGTRRCWDARPGEMSTWDGVDGAQQLLHVREVQGLVLQGRLCGDFHVGFCFQELPESVGIRRHASKTGEAASSVCLYCAGPRVTHEEGFAASMADQWGWVGLVCA